MAKRYPGAVRHVVTPNSYTYDGEECELYVRGGLLSNAVFAYWGDYNFVQTALYDLLFVNGALKLRLVAARRSSDIRSALSKLVDDTLIKSPGQSEYSDPISIKSSIARLSGEDLANIIDYLVLPRYNFPEHVPLWTFIEARSTCYALGDVPRCGTDSWHSTDDESIMLFTRRGDPHDIKFVASELSNTRSVKAAYEILNAHDQRTVLCFQLVLDAVIRAESLPVKISLYEIVRIFGLPARDSNENRESRKAVWTWLRTFASMYVIGARKGKYTDVKNLRSNDTLIKIVGATVLPDETGSYTDAPWEVELGAGEWLAFHRVNHRITTYVGDIMPLVRMRGGKAGVAWAQSIGMALLQHWRTKGSVTRTGETMSGKKRKALDSPKVTRRELLKMFPPSPTLDELRPRPNRAVSYWNAAIKILTDGREFISHIEEGPTFLDKEKPRLDEWLDQPLEIRPTTAIVEQMVEVKAKKPRSKKPGKPKTGIS